ncbi:DUF2945 domain-containing protein [Brevundimonas sp.]|uniref:DUF2945 domain-containing protein n=1 Tax=Brevundimonas sp. TaxID=1871086 RepID=UPI0025BE9B00|nr:DUF2945 domain-containing protein [Brevundimonas sp.]
MTDEERALVERWILAFCEAPPVVDAELMRRLIAEHESLEGTEMAEKRFKAGDRVGWDHSQGATTGRVIRKVVSETCIEGHRVAASIDNPEYVVESDRTGARAAHKPSALRKR